ncbi:MAG: hypothetical protein KDC80_26540 [Saprospiraceae bacterium]|nr:hypothetical protein [Saprospiraceae bacterium]
MKTKSQSKPRDGGIALQDASSAEILFWISEDVNGFQARSAHLNLEERIKSKKNLHLPYGKKIP